MSVIILTFKSMTKALIDQKIILKTDFSDKTFRFRFKAQFANKYSKIVRKCLSQSGLSKSK
jgi:hypothetical protein